MSKFAQLFKSGDTHRRVLSADPEPSDSPGPEEDQFTLLFVDDEPSVLSSLKRIFLDENYRILTAGGPLLAIDILAREKVHLIISDYRMPEMTGAEFLKKVKEEYPDSLRIMLTGDADIQSVMGAINEGAVYKFITKPWNDEDLRLTVSLALQQYVLVQENKKLKQLTDKQKLEINNFSSLLGENHAFLSNLLEKAGVLDQHSFQRAIKDGLPNEYIIQTLERLGLAREKDVAKALQDKLKLEALDLREQHLSSEVVGILPAELCRKKCMVPVRFETNTLTLAMGDPSDIYNIDNISRLTGFRIKTVVSLCSQIFSVLDSLQGTEGVAGDFNLNGLLDIQPLDEVDILLDEEKQYSVKDLLDSSEVPPIIRIVNAIVSEAIRYQASDIHIEPKTKFSVIRFRIDGILVDKIRIPAELHLATVSRIKILAKLDIAERRKPQDGRMTVKSGTRMVDLRVSTMPSINGEKIVMRLLDKSAAIKKLDQLGFMPDSMEQLTALIKKPQGIIISTGPTGSGKTTTLYSMLAQMLERSRNFETIEDPVEYYVEEANQIYIREKDGLSFPSVLRATLRQDPDVILVGEIRDTETADIAFKAALTGHMVLTSLHTNSSVASITRLIDLGVKPYLISSVLEGIIAQRLARKLCPHCRYQAEIDPQVKKLLRVPDDMFPAGVWKAKGCSRCDATGYSGRVGIYELFTMNDDFRHLISDGYKESNLLKLALSRGLVTLIQDGLSKVAQGKTSLEELLRVLGPQLIHERTCHGCQRQIGSKYQYCPYCGVPKQDVCPSCHEPVEGDWLVCAVCGAGLVK